VANPNTRPSAQITRPQSSKDRPLIPPRNRALARSGSTRAASPPAACCAGAASWTNPRNASNGVKLVMRDDLLGVAGREAAERVLQLRLLNEEVVLGVQAGGELRALEVEREPLLNAR